MGEYRMPSLGADMESGVVARWFVGPGDRVHKGDIVAAIETEKATIDAEVFEDGVIDRLLVAEGDEVPVGTPLATIASGEGPVATAAVPEAEPVTPEPQPVAAPVATQVAGEHVHSPLVRRLAQSLGVELSGLVGSGPGGEVTRADVEAKAGHPRAAPFVRRRARELGVDLATVTGSGPGGIVTLADLGNPEIAPAAAALAKSPARRRARTTEEQRAAMREQTAALMARSKREIPHYYLASTVELGVTLERLAVCNADRPPATRLLPVAALLKATAIAAREVPEMNGTFVGGTFRPATAVHLGVAIALRQGGLVAPVIHDVDERSVDEVMAALRDLVARARAERLRSSDVAEATMTVTSLGDLGVDLVLGVIYPPQVALVGFGMIAERPVAVDGLVGARPTVTVSLAADHRVSDGHLGARFLRVIGRALHDGEVL